MVDNVRWLRISYWVAAIADFVVAILVLITGRMGVSEFVYPMGLMSAIAFSWGVLLIYADRKPLERRWILLPTMLVVFLLGVTGVCSVCADLIPGEQLIATSVATVVILLLLAYSYNRSRNYQVE